MVTVTGTETFLRGASVALLAAAMIFAPLAWGSVTPGAEWILYTLLILAGLLGESARIGMFEVEARRGLLPMARRPRLLWAVIVALGWIAVLNPSSHYEETVWEFVGEDRSIGFLPASVDAASSTPVMVRISAMTVAFFVFLWILRDRRQRWKLFAAVALTAALISAAGICMKAAGSNTLLFSDKEYQSGWPFAVFRYHGHAAAYLNLAWPAALGLLFRSLRSRPHAGWRPLWIICLVLILTGVFANSSKGGHAVALVGLVVAGILYRKPLVELLQGRSRMVLWGSVLAVAVAIGAAVFVGGGVALQRWASLGGEQGAVTGRIEAYGYAWQMAKDAGIFGFGPGTFGIAFPAYTGGMLDRYWEHAHQDYLQVIIEWGWLGAVVWGAIFVGGIGAGVGELRARGQKSSCLSTRMALLALVMVGLHCSFDFPLQVASLQLLTCLWLACLWRLAKPRAQGCNTNSRVIPVE